VKNSLADEQEQQGGRILKKYGWIFYLKKIRNFFVSSLLMPDFVNGYFWALLCF
jgi:hypothetical protein